MSTEDLQEADTIAETQLLKPSALEIAAIKEYCKWVLEKRGLEADLKEKTKAFREAAKAAKTELLEFMKTSEDKTLTFSKAKLGELESVCAAEGLPGVVPYLRLVTSQKDSPIKAAFLEEALSTLTVDDLDEMKQSDKDNSVGPRPFRDLLMDVILFKLRHSIRSVTETLKMSGSLERGKKFHEIPENDSLADKFLVWHQNEARLKKAREAHKDTMADLATKIKECEAQVQVFFTRTQTTSQKLVLQDKTYRLVRKTTTKTSRVGLTTVQPWITECLDQFKVDTFRSFQKQQATVLKELQSRMDTQPIEAKTSVQLVAIKAATDE